MQRLVATTDPHLLREGIKQIYRSIVKGSAEASKEDEAVQAEIAAGNNELSLSVIISASDIEDMGAEMADPYAFLVPNTSCASCHRLNGLRFDFHSLSGFEDRGITVSPRVTKDVARDMFWARSALLR